MTRFGEISPLWKNLQSLGQFNEGIFPILAKFWTDFGNFCMALGKFLFV